MKTKLYTDISEADYHADNLPVGGITASRSLLWEIDQKCPMEAWRHHPKLGNERKASTAAMSMGTLAHRYLAGDDLGVELIDAPDYRSNAAQLARDDAKRAGRIPMLADAYGPWLGKIKKVSQLIDPIMPKGERLIEATLIGQDDDGTLYRVRPDVLILDGGRIIDHKTTTDLSDKAIASSINKWGYWFQAGFYRLIASGLGRDFTWQMNFIRLGSDGESPQVRKVELSAMWDDVSMPRIRAAMDTWATCLKSGIWPDYQPLVVDPPQWMIGEALDPDLSELELDEPEGEE